MVYSLSSDTSLWAIKSLNDSGNANAHFVRALVCTVHTQIPINKNLIIMNKMKLN